MLAHAWLRGLRSLRVLTFRRRRFFPTTRDEGPNQTADRTESQTHGASIGDLPFLFPREGAPETATRNPIGHSSSSTANRHPVLRERKRHRALNKGPAHLVATVGSRGRRPHPSLLNLRDSSSSRAARLPLGPPVILRWPEPMGDQDTDSARKEVGRLRDPPVIATHA